MVLDLLELAGIQRSTFPEDACQEGMGRSGDLRTLIEQILEEGRGLVRTAVVHENGGPEKLCFRPDVRALEEGLDRAQGGFALGLGVLVAGPVQK